MAGGRQVKYSASHGTKCSGANTKRGRSVGDARSKKRGRDGPSRHVTWDAEKGPGLADVRSRSLPGRRASTKPKDRSVLGV